MKGLHRSEDLDVDGRIILKCTVEKQGVKMRTEFFYLKTEFNDGLLRTCQSLKMCGIYWIVKQQLDFQNGIRSMELVGTEHKQLA
jgi:hypothetical protein